jgi:hypothetical protein
MRRLTSLFTHHPASIRTPVRTPVIPPHDGIVEIICAPQPSSSRRCLNEGGHKLSR